MASDPFYSLKAEVEEALNSILDERDMKRVLFDVEMLEDSIQRCLPVFACALDSYQHRPQLPTASRPEEGPAIATTTPLP